MPAISVYAPGKIILFGEHAVVYYQPAIAIPVHQVRANVKVFANPRGEKDKLEINAPDIDWAGELYDLPQNHPFRVSIHLLKRQLGIEHLPSMKLSISSEIPISAGLGSGTAVSVAMLKALSKFLGRSLTLDEISSLAFEVEKIYHGSPSGIDNTVITFEKPLFYIKDSIREILDVKTALIFLIADSGIASRTSDVVLDVQKRWQKNQARIESIFTKIGTVALAAKKALMDGHQKEIGSLMNQNQQLLSALGVSSPILDHLVNIALQNGALGAKLSGAGVGGNIIALVHPKDAGQVTDALLHGKASSVITTKLPA